MIYHMLKIREINRKDLNALGMNIFASVKISKLPKDIIEQLRVQNISFTDEETLCIIASGGKSLWQCLNHPLEESIDPIDQYSIKVMNSLSDNTNILYPHPKWNIPLQKIGRFLNIGRPSPLGLDINKNFGVWFAYRGVFLIKEKITEIQDENFNSPCERCDLKPCIAACPVNAVSFTNKNLNTDKCFEHQSENQSSCESQCLARLACPYNSEHQYQREQIKYHMKHSRRLYKSINS